jgi:hypothetical protein
VAILGLLGHIRVIRVIRVGKKMHMLISLQTCLVLFLWGEQSMVCKTFARRGIPRVT